MVATLGQTNRSGYNKKVAGLHRWKHNYAREI